MLAESHPYIRRVIRFMLLPYCYFKLVPWSECTHSHIQVLVDLLYIFFRFKYYPDNYGPCRFWEKDRSEWCYYYGSSYNPCQRQRLRKFVQRYDYQILYNDKEFFEQFAKGLQISMPRYFGVIEPDGSYKEKIKIFLNESSAGKIIIKPIDGHAGRGIMVARRTKRGVEVKTVSQVYELGSFELTEKSVVQELIEQHSVVAAITSSSVNTIRLVTLWSKNDDIILVSASMRFGQGDSFVDNWSGGGISVGVDTDSGVLKKFAYDKTGKRFTEHPVSGVKFNNFQIPMWDEIVKMAEVVQKASPFYRLIGCDVAVTESGPVLIEANANPDIVYQEQVSGPILADKRVFDEFNNYGLLINKYQKAIYGQS